MENIILIILISWTLLGLLLFTFIWSERIKNAFYLTKKYIVELLPDIRDAFWLLSIFLIPLVVTILSLIF